MSACITKQDFDADRSGSVSVVLIDPILIWSDPVLIQALVDTHFQNKSFSEDVKI